MNDIIHTGIVLQIISSKQSAFLFDDELGKIQIIYIQKKYGNLIQSGLINYIRTPWSMLYTLTDSTLIDLPSVWARDDIYFLHHVLELGTFFLPFHKNMRSVFDLFLKLYQPPLFEKNIFLYKKLFLCQFFSLMGVYPIGYSEYNSELINLISKPDDIMLNDQWDDVLEKQLAQWISECVEAHPYQHKLKTSSFFKYYGLI